ncbi:MAG TPA: LysE family translocator, partial [Actinomycetes bacterium]|nr:LysE family translocator [Actinomycetes bacterium]
MPETSTLALFAVAAVTLLVIPGPAVLYIVTRSVDQGRAAGLASVCGVHVGTLVHVAAAALGLSALLVSSATAYDTVRWLGAAYLVWLGVRRLMDHDEPSAPASDPRTSRLGL